jgi:hypothetical protein
MWTRASRSESNCKMLRALQPDGHPALMELAFDLLAVPGEVAMAAARAPYQRAFLEHADERLTIQRTDGLSWPLVATRGRSQLRPSSVWRSTTCWFRSHRPVLAGCSLRSPRRRRQTHCATALRCRAHVTRFPATRWTALNTHGQEWAPIGLVRPQSDCYVQASAFTWPTRGSTSVRARHLRLTLAATVP